MKKRGREGERREETCLLIAEPGAPWTECAAWLSTRTRDLHTVIQLPSEHASTFQSRLQEKLRLLGEVSTAVFVAASSANKLMVRSSLVRAVLGALPGVRRVVLCPGSDPQAPAARELAGLSLTMRELIGRSGAVTFSLEGPRGEPLRGLAHLSARAAA
ncbi:MULTISPECIES: hypothetical protein [Sorangium]|uniref:Uncharacterized protein n=1 Tax=Sorangium cellulosum TaxID=56 RepID=A0A4P2R4W9_SORCE|nr:MULTISPECIES: hypothetical protein [Sorangium]AUX38105.1 uncharacterized protein SOCE836_103450 [Sorangium cellulosum]WCQ97393.1 hypothetical protein NQZ70_10187 [Sorangium sp. Soce836]